ncbi:MAG TPA: MFS transporter [Novosphingobium sp.]|nr:MFS transporter [Novosphingobium sp.]
MPAGVPEDPRTILANGSMRLRQFLAIATCVALNALDGFDVLSISFASPGIAAEWGIGRGALGIVLSMELIGMAAGSMLLGPLADRVGRRPIALLCLFGMTLGMAVTAHVGSIGQLAACRFATGIGIGGMLACTNAMVAEYANDRWRGTAVAIMAAGYPLGAIAGGAFATLLLASGTWRDVFIFGAVVSVVLMPFVFILTPESVGFLMQRRRGNALARINRAMIALGHGALDALPPPAERPRQRTPLHRLFAIDLRWTTLLLTAAYFCHVMTFYFILKWVPKIVVDMGHAAAAAGGVLVYANIGGLLGSLVLSALALRIGLRAIMLGTMLISSAMVAWFGQSQAADLAGLSLAAAVAGFFTNAGMVGFYALIASSFPTAVRGAGTGFVIGIGRGGAALGPVIAGFLFEGGIGLPGVAAAMGLGSLIAAAAIIGLPRARLKEA